MSKDEKGKLLDLMNESYSNLFENLDGLHFEKVIYKDSGWRGREILSHMGAWNREIVKSLDEFVQGKEYLTPDFGEDQFNERTANAQKALVTAEVIEDWKLSVQEMTAAVENIPADEFPGDFLYPWGDERGSIFDLVKYFIDHDVEHIQEIRDFSKGS